MHSISIVLLQLRINLGDSSPVSTVRETLQRYERVRCKGLPQKLHLQVYFPVKIGSMIAISYCRGVNYGSIKIES